MPCKENSERQSYFTSHKCLLANPKQCYEIQCGCFRRFILDLVTVNTKDIRAVYMYKSYAAFRAEKYRQFSRYPLSIHPFSKLRLWLELVVCTSILVLYILKPFQCSIKDPDHGKALNAIIQVCNCIYLINIVANVLTGYVYGKNSQHVMLGIRRIILHYFMTWWWIDFLAVFSMAYVTIVSDASFTLRLALANTALMKLPVLFMYVSNINKVARLGMPAKTAVELTLCILTYLSWVMVFQFSVEFWLEGGPTPVNPRATSWMTQANLWNETSTIIRFFYGMERAVGMLRQNANLNVIKFEGSFEILIMVAWLVSKVIVLHCTFKFMLALFGSESARAKYYMIAQQVQTYMEQRRLPDRIKKKILNFYAIRYQSHFFVESRMMACVSGQLREDIIMFTGAQLMHDVEFLKQLPRALLLQIALRFKLVIFIKGDIIYKINTVGEYVYFISKGTVAMYSQSGREVCHHEDGDYFGEVALILKCRFRRASAVAVTNCELFILTREDFESIACYPTVYEKMKKAAASKMEQMCVIDEQHKAQERVLGEGPAMIAKVSFS